MQACSGPIMYDMQRREGELEGRGGGVEIRENSSCFVCGRQKEKEKVQGSEMRGN